MGIKVRKLKAGETLEVGDRIEVEHLGGQRRVDRITRVTNTLAISEGRGTSRYRRVVFWTGRVEHVPYSSFSSSSYTAWRPV